ncbi:hypothetical protein KKH23_00990 [Patescibacteria group bacterium]|nr:hypothetical protein [Patescibacteria group bacterium]MBU0777068.1 hypothetical protein [Patescibacteria group bacterium]MBU0845762.1 hypothetical protein [Patescibacteria group bacterium]MBU0923188.1 hypothetical protein [Patescibacteria group bacterium]MBU1066478.1 hypothetical protein [Patescibacteria group bacterium]
MKKVDITKNIMSKIKTGKVKIKPAFMVLGERYGVVGAIALLLTTAVLTFNIFLFLLKQTGNLEFLSFGSAGILAFLQAFPYFPVTIMLFVLFLAIRLLKYFDISYKKSFSFLALFIFASVLGLGIALANTKINARLENIPALRGFYHQGFGRNGFMGNILELKENSIIVERDDTDEVMEVFLTDDTNLPYGKSFSEKGTVRIIGSEKDGRFEAAGLRPFDGSIPANGNVKGSRKQLQRSQ